MPTSYIDFSCAKIAISRRAVTKDTFFVNSAFESNMYCDVIMKAITAAGNASIIPDELNVM
jgi:hypothetical protein